MKKFIVTLLISMSLWECSLQSDKIILDQNTNYIIPAEYKLTQISQIDVDVYKSLFGNTDNKSIVLYKTLIGSNKKIYVGIGFETNASSIKSEILSDNRNQILYVDSIPDKSFTIYLKRDSILYITHHFKILPSQNKYLFTAVTNEETDTSVFIKKYIDNQIIEN